MARAGVYLLSTGVDSHGHECVTRFTKGNLVGLAYALAASPIWNDMEGALLVVRRGREPMLGLLGSFDEADQGRIQALRWQLQEGWIRPRYISYGQAERDCEALGVQLIDRFGWDDLRRFHYLAIPRGGLMVLGMLSYILELAHTQLDLPPRADTPVVVTDDCAISGVRFGRFLEGCGKSPVVFAHLYSHPELRTAIEAREPRVLACLSAQDLVDHAPEQLGRDYMAWKERWLARSEPGYWVGRPDHICFPWNEPDISIWNPVTQEAEAAWRVVPPELCLKNLPPPGREPVRVQLQPEGKGPLRPAEHVLFGDFEERILVANTETGVCFSLTATAADIWRAILEHGNLADVETAHLGTYQVDKAVLSADLGAFVEKLLAQGLLERKDD